MDFSGKRVLITQNALDNFAGSEIVTLELTGYLASQGAQVTVYTFSFGKPIAGEFSKLRNVRVICDFEYKLSFSDFDIVWIHHQVLPPSMLKELTSGCKLPVIVFNHMSSMLSLEFPYISMLDKKISSVILFNSKQTRKRQKHFYKNISAGHLRIYPNPAPKAFIDMPRVNKGQPSLNKILVVSNHPVSELLAAIDELRKDGIGVDILGEMHEPELVTPLKLLDYDVVITIGKTTQYCLVMGIPVYCYDHFGGPGYLSSSNYIKTSDFNFSGRSFTKKTAPVIKKEIIHRFTAATTFTEKKRISAKRQYDIGLCLSRALKQVTPKGFVKIDPMVVESYIATMQLVKDFVTVLHLHKQQAINLTGELMRRDELFTTYEQAAMELGLLKRRKSVRAGLFLSSILGKLKKSFK